MSGDDRTHHFLISVRKFAMIYIIIMRFFNGLMQILRQKNIFDTIDTSESKTHTILVFSDDNEF